MLLAYRYQSSHQYISSLPRTTAPGTGTGTVNWGLATPMKRSTLQILDRTPEHHFVPSSANIYISIKTSSLTDIRLLPILLTWMQTVLPKQVIYTHTHIYYSGTSKYRRLRNLCR